MKNRKPPVEKEIETWLREGKLTLPPLRFQFTEAKLRVSDTGIWDYVITASWGAESAQFAVEYKSFRSFINSSVHIN